MKKNLLCRKADKLYDAEKCEHDIKNVKIKRSSDKCVPHDAACASQNDNNDWNVSNLDQLSAEYGWKKKSFLMLLQ